MQRTIFPLAVLLPLSVNTVRYLLISEEEFIVIIIWHQEEVEGGGWETIIRVAPIRGGGSWVEPQNPLPTSTLQKHSSGGTY